MRIGVHASGVNFPDILMAQGKYQVKPELPFVPGLELAGEVLQCAEGITHVRPGDRVKVLPSGHESTVKAVHTFDGELDEAGSPMSVSLC